MTRGRAFRMVLVLGASALAFLQATADPPASGPPQGRLNVVASTSLIECAVRDVAGDAARVQRIVPPGSCPGHFDLAPRDFERIVDADVAFLHDYQEGMQHKLAQHGTGGGNVVLIHTTGPQTTPSGYLDMCRQVAARLAALAPQDKPRIERRLVQISEEMDALDDDVRKLAAPLAGRVVVASDKQRGFLRYLGLDVSATFDTSDAMSLAELEEIVAKARHDGAAAVVSNRQRGVREGRALAEKLGVPNVVLSNFPPADAPRGSGLRDLVLSNVNALREVFHVR